MFYPAWLDGKGGHLAWFWGTAVELFPVSFLRVSTSFVMTGEKEVSPEGGSSSHRRSLPYRSGSTHLITTTATSAGTKDSLSPSSTRVVWQLHLFPWLLRFFGGWATEARCEGERSVCMTRDADERQQVASADVRRSPAVQWGWWTGASRAANRFLCAACGTKLWVTVGFLKRCSNAERSCWSWCASRSSQGGWHWRRAEGGQASVVAICSWRTCQPDTDCSLMNVSHLLLDPCKPLASTHPEGRSSTTSLYQGARFRVCCLLFSLDVL